MVDHVGIQLVMKEKGVVGGPLCRLRPISLGWGMSIIAIFLIATFFITSADSATFVLGTLTTHGNLNPPNSVKLTWGIVQSVAAAVLLWSGGLKGLQTGSILAAFPFTLIIIFMVISLFKAFKAKMAQ